MAAYGYEPYKLPGVKGNSLRIVPHEAKVVRMIFEMYGKQGMGYNAVAYKLNDLGIPSRTGQWGAMEDWLDEYIIQTNSDQKPAVEIGNEKGHSVPFPG